MRQNRSLLLVLGALLLALAALAPGFYAPGHLVNLLLDHAPLLVAASGMTLLIVAGQIDVAIGAELAVCAVVAGVAARAGLPRPLWIAAAIGAGVLLGLVHALLVVRLRIPALVATLATLAMLRGVLRFCTGGVWIQSLPPTFQWCGLGQAAGQMVYLVLTAALCAAIALLLRRHARGRDLYAVGCDVETAQLCGVRTGRALALAFVASGACAGVAAVLDQTRHPSVAIEAGTGLELAAIACAVLGGASIRGGRGGIAGTALGVLFFAAVSGLVFLGVEPVWERAIQGTILLAAVLRQSSPRTREVAHG